MADPDLTSDLTSLSKAELEALQRQVQDALSRSDSRRRQDATLAVEAAVKEFGFSLQEFLTLATGVGPKRSSRSKRDAGAKFRNPENPEETWSGRGRRPQWFKAHLEAGKTEDDLRV